MRSTGENLQRLRAFALFLVISLTVFLIGLGIMASNSSKGDPSLEYHWKGPLIANVAVSISTGLIGLLTVFLLITVEDKG